MGYFQFLAKNRRVRLLLSVVASYLILVIIALLFDRNLRAFVDEIVSNPDFFRMLITAGGLMILFVSAVLFLPDSSVVRLFNRFLRILLGIEVGPGVDRYEETDDFSTIRLRSIETEINKLKMATQGRTTLDPRKTEKLLAQVSATRIIQATRTSLEKYMEPSERAITRTEAISEIFNAILNKIDQERQTLNLRTGLNGMFGLVIAAIGIYVMWSFVGKIDLLNIDMNKAIIMIVSRFSLIFVLSVFALFFLNLYRSGLNDMKYYINEYTNISSMYAAARMALLLDDKALIAELCGRMSEVERNFILKKGETTINLQQGAHDRDFLETLLSKTSSIQEIARNTMQRAPKTSAVAKVKKS